MDKLWMNKTMSAKHSLSSVRVFSKKCFECFRGDWLVLPLRGKSSCFCLRVSPWGQLSFRSEQSHVRVTTQKFYCSFYFAKTQTWIARMKALSFSAIFPEWDLLFHAFLMTFDLTYQPGACVQLGGVLHFVTPWYLLIPMYTHTHTQSNRKI